MRIAALDLGTNTFLLLVAEVIDGKIVKVLHDEAKVVRLGQGVNENRKLHIDALKRAGETFAGFAKTIERLKPEKVLAYATSAARDATNANELISLAASFKIPLQIITGEKEAETTFLGTYPDTLKKPILIIDIGGGSTEFIYGDQNGIKKRESIDIGAVRLTEMFVTANPILDVEVMKMTAFVQNKMAGIRSTFQLVANTKIIGVAGTPTTLAAVDQGRSFSSEDVDGYQFSLEKIAGWLSKLGKMTIPERQALSGMEPGRADVLVAGALILKLSLENFGADGLEVSVRGLRYGIAKQMESE